MGVYDQAGDMDGIRHRPWPLGSRLTAVEQRGVRGPLHGWTRRAGDQLVHPDDEAVTANDHHGQDGKQAGHQEQE
ncbi:hypothetical protein D3C72_2374500 [compost metagenome]